MHDHAAVVKALLHYFEHNWKSNWGEQKCL
jgi:hypothetical protein